jgi:hypothetical protein
MQNTPEQHSDASATSTTTMVELIVAWLWVGIPLAWGVVQTLRQAMKLFQ